MASKGAARKSIQLWLKERDEAEMIKNFTNLVQQHGVDLLMSFRRESTKHEHAIVHELVQQGKPKVLKFLVDEYGFDLNVQRLSDQSTPLHLAQWTKQQELVKLLLALGADINVKNVWGETACQTKEAPRPVTALLTGAKTGDDIIKLIDERFVDFGDESIMYAFKLLGEKTADYDEVGCKFVSCHERREELQASTAYQRLSKAMVALACDPRTVENGSTWSVLLRTLMSWPDQVVLDAVMKALENGSISSQEWDGNHLAACICALAKLGVATRWWALGLKEFGRSLQAKTQALHEGDLIKVLWALGQMRVENDPLLVACAGHVLELTTQTQCQPHVPQMLCMAIWAHIRTSSRNKNILLRLASAIKQHVPDFDINMNVTLPACCFAMAAIDDEELHSAIFSRASVTMYESRSRHHKKTSEKEKLMSWAQMYVAYRYCCSNCTKAIQGMSMQLRKDLSCISDRRTGACRRTGAPSVFPSESSGLSGAELDKIIEKYLTTTGEFHYEDSLEEQKGFEQSDCVASANAAMSQKLLGKDHVTSFILLEFRRDPEAFHAALLEGAELRTCRQLLEKHGFSVELASGAKVFVRPEVYHHACEMANAQGLLPRHVLLEPEFEDAVHAAIVSLPRKLKVILKRKSDNLLVFAAKRFSAGTCGAGSSGYGTVSSGATVEEDMTWEVKRTFIEFPIVSSLCSAVGSRVLKSV